MMARSRAAAVGPKGSTRSHCVTEDDCNDDEPAH
jgi:hypothetical protein